MKKRTSGVIIFAWIILVDASPGLTVQKPIKSSEVFTVTFAAVFFFFFN